MCFSAEASFTVGSILGVIGVVTLKQVKKRSLLFIAIIPILFGVQQLLEGMVWMHMHETFIQTSFSQIVVNLYLFFAWLFWPVFIPFAFFIAETSRWKRILFACACMWGLGINYVGLRYMADYTITPVITGHSLDYGFTHWYANIFYGLSIFTPIFLSSIPQMQAFGICLFVSFMISQLIYSYTFTSVWCFFCAAISVYLLKILREAQMVSTNS